MVINRIQGEAQALEPKEWSLGVNLEREHRGDAAPGVAVRTYRDCYCYRFFLKRGGTPSTVSRRYAL